MPAAIAWACNPQAYLRISPTTVSPGGQLNVSGAFFKGNASLTITIEGGSSTSVTTTGNGSFSTAMTAPSTPGSYTISAVGFEPDGSVTNGLPARASFTVGSASQSGGGSGSTPQQGSSPGPGSTQQGAASPGGGRFAEPDVPNARRTFSTPGSRSGGGGGGGGGGSASGGGSAGAGAVVAGAGVIDGSAGPVFAGSVARQERNAGAAGSGGSAPSERSAGSDIWAGFQSAGAPSLRADAGEGAPDGGAGSELGWGLAVLGLGFLALVSGLAVAGVRSRRKAVGR